MGFLLAVLAPGCQAGEDVIGSVKSAAGVASILREGRSLEAKQGMHIFAQDVLATGAGGTMGVLLHDGTRISLNANSEIRVDQFVYEPVAGKFSLVLQLMRGAAAYVSGKIAEMSPQSVKLETPVAMLGLRGTKFIASLDTVEVKP